MALKTIINTLIMIVVFIPALSLQAEVMAPAYTLDEIWELAIKNNQTIKIAGYQNDMADAGVSKAWARIVPKLDLAFLGNYYAEEAVIEFEGNKIEIFPKMSYTFTAKLTQPLFAGFRSINGIKIANTYREITNSSGDLTREQMYMVIAGLYHKVKMRESQIGILERSIDLADKELNKAKLRFEVGDGIRTDVLLADLDLKSAQNQLVLTRNEYVLAKENLSRLVGINGKFTLEEPKAFSEPRGTEKELLAEAYDRRQEMKIALLNQKNADLKSNMAWGGLLPIVFLEAQYFQQSADFPASSYASVGVVVSYPIWDGGKTLADISTAKAEKTIAELEIMKLRDGLALDVKKALADLKTITATLETAEAQEKLAKENYELNSALFEVGDATALELSQALVAYNKAQMAVSNTRYQRNLAVLNLKRSIGDIFSN